MSSQKATYNTGIELRANKFTRSGYKFSGWYAFRASDNTWYASNGEWLTDSQIRAQNLSRKTLSNKRTVYKLSPVNGDTITLYANWTQK